jgi:C-terminal processing protease CtpA/Prc
MEAVGVTGIDFKQARDLILGRQGTSVNLRFRRDSQTYPVTLIRGNSDYIQLEHKHQALVKENENLRLQLRRQNDESEAQVQNVGPIPGLISSTIYTC